MDNTLIFVVIGDNGASKEGSSNGDIDRSIFGQPLNEAEALKYNLNKIGEIGTPLGTETNYPLGWAQAANTPFKFWKQDANAEGGTHNPLIVFYPKGIKEKGGIRNQYGHVIDLLPTTVEYIGGTLPTEIRGIKQQEVQGTSLVYSFENAQAPSRHTLQHYYIFGNRSIYKDGWKAEAAHHPDFIDLEKSLNEHIPLPQSDFNKDVWELYNLNEDFTESNDLAAKYPEKLAELKKVFDEQAKKNNIYPLIDWEDVFKGRIHHTNGHLTMPGIGSGEAK